VPRANFIETVYHGLPLKLLRPLARPSGEYVAFLGRISPEKRPDRAIAIARALGVPLKIAAKVDRVDEVYYREQIEPLLAGSDVDFIGEINEHQKAEFLGNARALLFPIDWPEPFGLVMIEAMACGTPVIAFNRGSVPEIVEDGLTGFVVEDEAMIAMLVEDMILDFGSEVVGPAAQMEEALRLAQEAEQDAAILDLKLGGAVVFPVAEVLRNRTIPFIFATGYGSAAAWTSYPPSSV